MHDRLREIFEGIVVVSLFVIPVFLGGLIDSVYSMNGIITNINAVGTIYEVTDTMGEVYEFYGEYDDFRMGQGVKVYFNTNQTTDRTDDIVVKIKGK